MNDLKPVSPAVSVIISAYNKPDYVNQAVESVLSQTFTDYEIIVVDDCSTEDVVARYRLPECARLIRLDRRHGLACPGRNVGISAACGKYIAFLDQDDIWLPGKLGAQVKVLEERGVPGLVYCRATQVDESLSPLTDQGRSCPMVSGNALRQILGGCFVSLSSVLLTCDVLQNVGTFDEGLACSSDWDMWIRVAGKYPFHALPESHVLYRKHPGQLSRGRLRMRTADVQILEKALRWTEAERPELVPLVRKRLSRALERLIRRRISERKDLPQSVRLLRRAWSVRRSSPQTWLLAVRLLVLGALGSGQRTKT